jgi:hypothetical protein
LKIRDEIKKGSQKPEYETLVSGYWLLTSGFFFCHAAAVWLRFAARLK